MSIASLPPSAHASRLRALIQKVRSERLSTTKGDKLRAGLVECDQAIESIEAIMQSLRDSEQKRNGVARTP